mmetsp:Transcript_21734/g.26792  ORF Transcript_21734/g.26792 Transcript_21734/m.26792 type:complete len:142 (+) Transcript_21734:279-704(+)
MVDEMEKLDLPAQEEEEKKGDEEHTGGAQSVEHAFLECCNKGAEIFELDNLDIRSLKSLPHFPDTTEQISFFGNSIENPNDIAEVLVSLPNLRALWLNGNPVVDTCSNFSAIAELMPKLEILNSQLTNKAGEWAMNFYAKE